MPKVMLIEDDETMLSLLDTLLQIEGFTVVKLDGKAGIEHMMETLRNEQPSLLLLDVYLHEFSGLELVRQIRQDRSLDGIRVLMSSGMALREECLNAGADEFILKPYMPDDLIHSIVTTIGK